MTRVRDTLNNALRQAAELVAAFVWGLILSWAIGNALDRYLRRRDHGRIL